MSYKLTKKYIWVAHQASASPETRTDAIELYVRVNGRGCYKIKLDDVNNFEKFLRSEHEIHEKYPEIYKAVPADTHTTRKKPKPQPKGDNTIIGLFGLMRAFYRWCRDQ